MGGRPGRGAGASGNRDRPVRAWFTARVSGEEAQAAPRSPGTGPAATGSVASRSARPRPARAADDCYWPRSSRVKKRGPCPQSSCALPPPSTTRPAQREGRGGVGRGPPAAAPPARSRGKRAGNDRRGARAIVPSSGAAAPVEVKWLGVGGLRCSPRRVICVSRPVGRRARRCGGGKVGGRGVSGRPRDPAEEPAQLYVADNRPSWADPRLPAADNRQRARRRRARLARGPPEVVQTPAGGLRGRRQRRRGSRVGTRSQGLPA